LVACFILSRHSAEKWSNLASPITKSSFVCDKALLIW
jgi:hypothetical protein